MTEDETVGWHHRLNRHEFERAPGVGDGQGGLACCSPWGRKQLDMTELTDLKNMWGHVWVIFCPSVLVLGMGVSWATQPTF